MQQDQRPSRFAAAAVNLSRRSDNHGPPQHYMLSPRQILMEGFSHLSVGDVNPHPTLLDRHASQSSNPSVASLDSQFVPDINWQPPGSIHIPSLQDVAWWLEPFGDDVHDLPPDADLSTTVPGESSQLASPLDGSSPCTGQVDARLDRKKERRREQNRQAQRRHRERRNLNFCLTQGKVRELQAALATALEQQQVVKQENTHLRGRLASLQAEVDSLRTSISPAAFGDGGLGTPSEFELGT
ncbi:hypothetical protein AYL99_05728 [Fonsecaea erecta]|uniref:BZIP domain-containing protein n=1 Tax=Fonsecaea erecta TaxID=1367422 RepID=A0A178ZMX8_9EURO|nr:hypothetical protein AYL99_05728 [Fonsecaea erecta]OAP60726.1 hypothetical protein AYL99_05728 [Fonsecaea erecta]